MSHRPIRLEARPGTLNGKPWISDHLPQGANERATAAYNFVPLPEAILVQQMDDVPKHDLFGPGLLSGHIDCTFRTVTPLYVRAAWTPDHFKTLEEQEGSHPRNWNEQKQLQRNQAESFHHGNPERPSIPASTLRGMVRAVVAAATWSQPKVGRQHLSYRAIGDQSSIGDDYLARFLDRKHQLDADEKAYEAKAKAAHGPDAHNFNLVKATFRLKAGYVKRVGDETFIRAATSYPTGPTIGDITFFRVPKSNVTRPIERHYQKVWFDPSAIVARFHEHGTTWKNGTEWKRLRLGYARVDTVSLAQAADLAEGTLVWTAGSRKKLQYLFGAPDDSSQLLEVSEKVLADLRHSLARSEPIDVGDINPRDVLLDVGGNLIDRCPIFYLPDAAGTSVKALGYTMMFRLPFDAEIPKDSLPDYGVKADTEVDLAEAIFGWTRDTQLKSRRGRVRFTSARCVTSGDVRGDEITPKILGTPKPTTFQHYLEQRAGGARRLAHYGTQPRAAIRGFKRYWPVQGELRSRDIEAAAGAPEQAHTQYTRIRPIREKTDFSFTIRFQNLRREELGALLWALEPRTPANARYEPVHQLGMGKALGLGTVRLSPTLHVEERRGQEGRYGRLFAGGTWHTPAMKDAPSIDELLSAFEQSIDGALATAGAVNTKAFVAHQRIVDLLALMDLKGASTADRRTLQVTLVPQVNEFRRRKVLPSASRVRNP